MFVCHTLMSLLPLLLNVRSMEIYFTIRPEFASSRDVCSAFACVRRHGRKIGFVMLYQLWLSCPGPVQQPLGGDHETRAWLQRRIAPKGTSGIIVVLSKVFAMLLFVKRELRGWICPEISVPSEKILHWANIFFSEHSILHNYLNGKWLCDIYTILN